MHNSDHIPGGGALGQDRGTAGDLSGKSGKNHKILYRLLGIVIILTIVFGMDYLASLSFDSVRIKDYYNYDINRLDQENADVDMIITGTSQVYRGCSPDVLSEELGIGEVIDCASALGTNNGTYYMLRDLFNRFEPEYVLISLPWDAFIPRQGGGKLWGEMLIADRLPFLDRLEYVFTCLKPGEWMNLSAMYRFGGTIWGTSQILKNYRDRKAIAEGRWVDESMRVYRKNGYCWYTAVAPRGSIPAQPNVFSSDMIDDEETAYVRKMIELCRKEGAEVILFTVPTAMEEVYSVENYQESVDYTEAFANEMGCEYLNFNLLKNREERLPDETFSDHVHMNGPGSEVFSKILADTLKKTLNKEDTESLFYENFDEMKKDVHRIVACSGIVVRGGQTADISVTSFQNEDIVPEYRILTVEKEEPQVSEDTEENSGNGGESAGHADNEGEDGGNVSEGDVGEAVPETVTELCTWQSTPAFTVEEALIPPGTTVRVEVRQAGGSTADAYYDIPA